MLISLRSDHKDHLKLLTTQPPQVLVDFCKLAIDFLQKGPNLKLYTTVAEKLSVTSDSIQNSIYGLVNLLLISCKHKLDNADFRDSVLTLGFSSDQQIILSKFYTSKKQDITSATSTGGFNNVDELHYGNLEWRFEVQVSSRSLLHQTVPLIAMDLLLKRKQNSGFDEKHVHLQTDPTNLLHVANELEKALIESRSRHSRKVQKALDAYPKTLQY